LSVLQYGVEVLKVLHQSSSSTYSVIH